MNDISGYIASLSLPLRLAAFFGFAAATHIVVIIIRHAVGKALLIAPGSRYQKLRSIGTLATSAIIFTLYFLAIGFILREFGVSLTAYLASASVIGLAVGFGSQGVVQDVVTGLTFIFSDLVDVGDLVEISGQTGVVKAITMRFVELENSLGARVFIPNRTINNVINYQRGYIRCLVDVSLRGDEQQKNEMEIVATRLMHVVEKQFPGIFIKSPSNEGRLNLGENRMILRLKFRIWPGRQQPLEANFYQQLVAELTGIDPEYKAWMVSISYEAEARIKPLAKAWLWKNKS